MAAAVIPALTRWGLSADADLVYRGLVLVGPMDEHRLTRELGMTRARVRAAVDELAATEAVAADRGHAWSPSPPNSHHASGLLSRCCPRVTPTSPRPPS